MFISLEGPDGSGKTTQIAPLADFLRQRGLTVITTREPGGTAIGEQVRTVLHRLDNTAMHPRSETLLYLAARAQLVEEVIRPALARGEVVLCDRYADSTLAYQGYGHGNDLQILRQLLHFATGGLWPDLTLLFDLSAEEGLRRRQTGGGEWNRLDAYQLAFHQRVCLGYRALAAQQPERWAVIDAARTPQAIQNDLREVVVSRLVSRQVLPPQGRP
jgi:dTMP kinase